MKNTIIIICATGFMALCGFLAMQSGQSASDARQNLNQERYSRMLSEENLEKANAKISSLEADLERTQSKIKNIENLVQQTKELNTELKNQLDKSARVNEELDHKVKEIQQNPSAEAPANNVSKPAGDSS